MEAKGLCSNSTEFLSCVANNCTVLRAIGNQIFHNLSSLSPQDASYSLILFCLLIPANLGTLAISDMDLFSEGSKYKRRKHHEHNQKVFDEIVREEDFTYLLEILPEN
ncbi:hypothetical protein Lal_00001636 [Lupinus albus]|nr:hypothetical protein Lal_00001636 [Lupinus albus]